MELFLIQWVLPIIFYVLTVWLGLQIQRTGSSLDYCTLHFTLYAYVLLSSSFVYLFVQLRLLWCLAPSTCLHKLQHSPLALIWPSRVLNLPMFSVELLKFTRVFGKSEDFYIFHLKRSINFDYWKTDLNYWRRLFRKMPKMTSRWTKVCLLRISMVQSSSC